jgi:hypothetical protein
MMLSWIAAQNRPVLIAESPRHDKPLIAQFQLLEDSDSGFFQSLEPPVAARSRRSGPSRSAKSWLSHRAAFILAAI